MSSIISPEEYASLPASIQKKYFSTRERLCIAQQSAVQSRKKQHGKLGSWLSSASTADILSTRPSTSGGLHSLKPKPRSHDSKLFQVRFADVPVSDEEARWFLALPEKVKQKRFSREELVSLTAKCQRVLAKSATDSDQDTVRRRRSVHRLEASACTPIATASSSRITSVEVLSNPRPPIDFNEARSTQAQAAATRRIPTDVAEFSRIQDRLHDEIPAETDQAVKTAVDASDAEMEIVKLYLQRRSLRLKAPTSRADRSLPDSPPPASTQPTKRKSHHRLHMLTPLPLPPPVLAPPMRPRTSTPFSTSARLSRPFFHIDPLALDDETTSNYESSGQSTHSEELVVEGEVLELPANEEIGVAIAMDVDCPHSHLASAFSDDGAEDCDKDDDGNLDTESVETVGPRTPSPMDYRATSVEHVTSDSGVDLPELHLEGGAKTASVLDRQSRSLSTYSSPHHSMTAHELRTSSEDMLYAYQRRLTSGVDLATADPLALEALPVCDDETGAHGAFAVSRGQESSSKGLRKVIKSFTRL